MSSTSVEFIMLCGGIGSRLNQGLFPKPLTLVNGKPLIYRVLQTLDIPNLTLVLNQHLKQYNFEALVKKRHVTIPQVKFWYLPFDTRGAMESLLLYLKTQYDDVEVVPKQIVILDNDNIYNLTNVDIPSGSGLLYTKQHTQLTHYSFILLDNGLVKAIEEKNRISDNICVGYFLSDIASVTAVMKKIVTETHQQSEYYLSILYQELIKQHVPLKATEVQTVLLGTIEDITNSDEYILKQDTEDIPSVVFDIDNTLIATDGTVIDEQTKFLKLLKSRGWRVILYTARGMKHTGNIVVSEEVMSRVREDIKHLEGFYDELHFNKPYADLYIDDKAFNPYDETVYEKMGFFNICNSLRDLHQASGRNILIRSSYKTISKHSDNSLIGEINFYRLIARTKFWYYFPTLRSSGTSPILSHFIEIDYISGPTFSNLFLEGLLSEEMLTRLMNLMDELHMSEPVDSITLTYEDLRQFYLEKFYQRYQYLKPLMKIQGYERDHETVFSKIEESILEYIEHSSSNLVNIVHGDLWFRNILLCKKQIQLIDMRGVIGSKVTLRGDKMYDYAKLYQSLLGMDYCLAGKPLSITNCDTYVKQLRKCFETRYTSVMSTIKMLSSYTIYCSLPSWEMDYYGCLITLLKQQCQ